MYIQCCNLTARLETLLPYRLSPSSFGFAIPTSRNWFVIWMGFLSFIIASSESQSIPNSPLPCWHRLLLDNQISPPWLDGLASSGICSFDTQTPRAGVVFSWTHDDCTRPKIAWFYNRNIPLFFVWSQNEENIVASSESFAYLRPPNHLLQRALGFLRKTPNLASTTLVMRHFLHLEEKMELNVDKVKALGLQNASSFVTQAVTKAYLQQHRRLQRDPSLADQDCHVEGQQTTKGAVPPLPFQGMLEIDEEERGKLFNHFKDFLALREKRQAELLKVESRKKSLVSDQNV